MSDNEPDSGPLGEPGTEPVTVTCPGCDLEFDEADYQGQVEHLQAEHTDIISRTPWIVGERESVHFDPPQS
jgi:hypothetical protein